jgi:hypothetical protein
MFEDLFVRYSKLALTKETDMPFAISGLIRKLEIHHDTRVTYGIVHRFLHRSLLWERAGSEMKPISYSRDEIVPSWSWMAYEGETFYRNDAAWHFLRERHLDVKLQCSRSNAKIQYILTASLCQFCKVAGSCGTKIWIMKSEMKKVAWSA